MAEKSEFVLEDFTAIANHIDMALDRINTIYESAELTEERKSELGRLGRSLYETGHEIGHFFLTLDSLPSKLKEELQEYFSH